MLTHLFEIFVVIESEGAFVNIVGRVCRCDLFALNSLHPRSKVLHANVLDVDMRAATCAFIYLVPKGMQLVAPRLKALAAKAGGRVVSYVFSVPGKRKPQPTAANVCVHDP